jgi:hypothetical protein
MSPSDTPARVFRPSLPWLLLLLTPISCAGLSLRVGGDSMKALPVEERLELLDAENDLFAAIDRRDDALQALDDDEDTYGKTGKLLSSAQQELNRARDENDQQGVSVGKLAVEEARAHRKYADHAIDLGRDELDVASAYVLVAEAQFEKAKAEAVVRAKVKGASGVVIARFDEQVRHFQRRAKSIEHDLQSDTKSADAIRARWTELSHQLSDQTGGAQGSPWVE